MEIKATLDQGMTYFFTPENQANPRVQMGVIKLQPGERSPVEGYACHEQDEYSYVVSGLAHTILEDGTDLVGSPGDAQLIAANEKHINYNDGDDEAVVVWMLVDRD